MFTVPLCLDSLLLHAFRDSGQYGAQGDQSSEDPLSLAAAVHAGQQSIPAGLQEALPDPADLWELSERDAEPQLQERQQEGGEPAGGRGRPACRGPDKPGN